MKNLILLILITGISVQTFAQQWASKDKLNQDYELLVKSLKEVHGGLYRYDSKEKVQAGFDKYREAFVNSSTQKEAYLALSEMLANVVKDGHTYPNYWNQQESVRNELFRQADKLPFTLSYIENKWLISEDVSDNNLQKGTRIVSINGIPTEEVITKLKNVFKVDGSNQIKKYDQLNLSGQDAFEPVDIYLPMLIPPVEGKYAVGIEAVSGKQSVLEVETISRGDRQKMLADKFGIKPVKNDDLWEKYDIDSETAYLREGSYVIWRMELDWKAFIKDFFVQANKTGKKNIIIDIRGNSGGMGEVFWYTMRYLAQENVAVDKFFERTAYQKVSEEVKPYLEAWDKSLFNLSSNTLPAENGLFKKKGKDSSTRTVRPNKDVFKGNVYLLTDGSNSSATFMFAKAVASKNIGVTVGDYTGGNMKGITGGQMFMLRLPNSNLEVDLPIIGYYPAVEQEDNGLAPDHLIKNTKDDFINGNDRVMQYTLDLISGIIK